MSSVNGAHGITRNDLTTLSAQSNSPPAWRRTCGTRAGSTGLPPSRPAPSPGRAPQRARSDPVAPAFHGVEAGVKGRQNTEDVFVEKRVAIVDGQRKLA